MLDDSKSVLERGSIGHSSGQFFSAGMRTFFGTRLLPPCSLGGLQADAKTVAEYGCRPQ